MVSKRALRLVKLASLGIKGLSELPYEEGLIELVREAGLSFELRDSGCARRVLFGRKELLERYLRERGIRERGLLLGYPECCARYFEEFMEGKREEKPRRMPPLEHFVCPGCRESPALKDIYESI